MTRKDAYTKALNNSACKVQFFKKRGALISVWIEFSGDLAHFPSTSNSRYLGRRNPSAIGKLEAAADLYRISLTNTGAKENPTFGTEPVVVMVHLAKRNRKFDSHNMAKPIGDWLEDVGLIDDDTHAEIDAKKREEYSGFCYPETTTRIIIIKRKLLQSLREQTELEAMEVAKGNVELIG